MTRSYSIRQFAGKPPDKFSVPVQIALPGCDDTQKISYEILNKTYMEGISKYKVYYDLYKKKIGRTHGVNFTYYYEPNIFPFYFDHHRNLIYICARKDVVKGFLRDSKLEDDWQEIGINFEKMTPFLPAITGVWFAELKYPYVTSACFNGRHVDKSEDFKKAAASGQISVLYIKLPWPDSSSPECRVGITSNSSIIINQNFEVEEMDIELIAHVFDSFIAPTLEPSRGQGTS